VTIVPGTRLGPYVIETLLGAGGMGQVWRAHDTRLERDVALKVLPAEALGDDTARARLIREARLASKLNHPHICTVYDVGEANGQTYIAMELVEGQSLAARVAEDPLPVEQVVRYGQQMADATTVTRHSLTAPGVVAGTLAYMAPEQLKGEPADARSDIWALGVVLYELATGKRPFEGQTGFDLTAAILRQPPPPRPSSVPAPLAGVIERCLAKEPGERHQQGSEVRAALEAVACDPASRAPRGRRRASSDWPCCRLRISPAVRTRST
jgi:serine/threonine protein kinase